MRRGHCAVCSLSPNETRDMYVYISLAMAKVLAVYHFISDATARPKENSTQQRPN